MNVVIVKNVTVFIVLLIDGTWFNGKTLDLQLRDCELDPRSNQLNLLKGDMT